jgi:hypothetical protein
MTDPAVRSNEQQRKEVRRRRYTMLTKRRREDQDQQMPRVWRAAIYLRGLGEEVSPICNVPSIWSQRMTCRCAATVIHAEVVGEFLDIAGTPLPHPGLGKVFELADERLDYLIVSSLDRLAVDRDEAFEVAWRLGFAGTVVIAADAVDEFPWTKADHPAKPGSPGG